MLPSLQIFVSDSCSLILLHKKITLILCSMYEKTKLYLFVSMCIDPFKNNFELVLQGTTCQIFPMPFSGVTTIICFININAAYALQINSHPTNFQHGAIRVSAIILDFSWVTYHNNIAIKLCGLIPQMPSSKVPRSLYVTVALPY